MKLLIICDSYFLGDDAIHTTFDYISKELITRLLGDTRYHITIKKHKYKFQENYLNNKNKSYDHVISFSHRCNNNGQIIRYMKNIAKYSYNTICFKHGCHTNETNIFHLINPNILMTSANVIIGPIIPIVNFNKEYTNKCLLFTSQNNTNVLSKLASYDIEYVDLEKISYYQYITVLHNVDICVITSDYPNEYMVYELLFYKIKVIIDVSLKHKYIKVMSNVYWMANNDIDFNNLVDNSDGLSYYTYSEVCSKIYNKLKEFEYDDKEFVEEVVPIQSVKHNRKLDENMPLLLQTFY